MGFDTEGTREWIVRFSLMREMSERLFSISRVSIGVRSSNDRMFFVAGDLLIQKGFGS